MSYYTQDKNSEKKEIYLSSKFRTIFAENVSGHLIFKQTDKMVIFFSDK